MHVERNIVLSRISHKGVEVMAFRFPYDRPMIEAVKRIPGIRYVLHAQAAPEVTITAEKRNNGCLCSGDKENKHTWGVFIVRL